MVTKYFNKAKLLRRVVIPFKAVGSWSSNKFGMGGAASLEGKEV
jgi:hypothetical protein